MGLKMTDLPHSGQNKNFSLKKISITFLCLLKPNSKQKNVKKTMKQSCQKGVIEGETHGQTDRSTKTRGKFTDHPAESRIQKWGATVIDIMKHFSPPSHKTLFFMNLGTLINFLEIFSEIIVKQLYI